MRCMSHPGIGFAEFHLRESAIHPRSSAAASDPVWLRLSAGLCTQDVPKLLRLTAHFFHYGLFSVSGPNRHHSKRSCRCRADRPASTAIETVTGS